MIRWYSNHEVVGRSGTLKEALQAIEGLGRLGVQVALVDGNLSRGDFSGSDGTDALNALREHAPDVKTIGYSGNQMPDTDVDIGKAGAIEELLQAITDL